MYNNVNTSTNTTQLVQTAKRTLQTIHKTSRDRSPFAGLQRNNSTVRLYRRLRRHPEEPTKRHPQISYTLVYI